MIKVARTIAYAGVLAAAIAAAPSYAFTQADEYGAKAPDEATPDRVITVDSGTRWVNVNYGETVKFIVKGTNGEQDFAWRFDGLDEHMALSAIDPEANLGRDIKIYVDESMNPLHRSVANDGGE
jgi:hypothetical protein